MDTIIKIIGIIIILMSILYLAKPDIIKHLMEFFKKGLRVYIIALTRFVLAVVFLLAATQCNHPRLVTALGILFLISGLLVIILGPKKIGPIFEWYLAQPPMIFRILSVITLVFGALVLYAA
jgi:hypothetical protein